MKITIEAQDMLEVLIQAGIDTIDAKAIIYDLLQLPEDGRDKLIEARRRRKEKQKTLKKEVVLEDLEEEEEEAIEEKKEGAAVKKPKRVNFSNFGGVAEPLR